MNNNNSIEISSDDETPVETTQKRSSPPPDVFSNITTEQLLEMTELIEKVLPAELKKKQKRKKTKRRYMNKLKIDMKASKIVETSASNSTSAKKTRLKLPSFRIVNKIHWNQNSSLLIKRVVEPLKLFWFCQVESVVGATSIRGVSANGWVVFLEALTAEDVEVDWTDLVGQRIVGGFEAVEELTVAVAVGYAEGSGVGQAEAGLVGVDGQRAEVVIATADVWMGMKMIQRRRSSSFIATCFTGDSEIVSVFSYVAIAAPFSNESKLKLNFPSGIVHHFVPGMIICSIFSTGLLFIRLPYGVSNQVRKRTNFGGSITSAIVEL
jgi:hypothetical protein